MPILLSRTAADTDEEPKKFLGPCRFHPTDADSMRQWGELWAQPDIYAYAFWPVQELIDRATADVVELFSNGTLNIRPPFKPDFTRKITPRFVEHGFWVPAAGTWVDGKWDVRGRCCSGLGDFNHMDLVISCRNPLDVPGLIVWETTNVRLDQAGRRDWADKHSELNWETGERLQWLITPDPAPAPHTSKRRSAGRR